MGLDPAYLASPQYGLSAQAGGSGAAAPELHRLLAQQLRIQEQQQARGFGRFRAAALPYFPPCRTVLL